MKLKIYYYLMLQFIFPVIIVVSKKLGDAPLDLYDVYFLLCLQLFMASVLIVAVLKKG
jgi:hypothetical protein